MDNDMETDSVPKLLVGKRKGYLNKPRNDIGNYCGPYGE